MCKVQEEAKHERQNDDYATAKTPQNSSSHHDEAHCVRRRLLQTITSRSCLLFAIALASLSAHACDDTVELQVTCNSGETPWVVKSSDASGENTTVTVGSCIEGRVKDVAQVKEKDIDANGIVLCAQPKVCYHLKRQSGKIEAKNCDGYGDPICNYICHDGSITHKKENVDSNLDDTAKEKNNDKIICDGSTDKAYIYECNGNIIVRKTHCPLGCDENGNQCKTNICKSGKQYECKDGTLFKCGNAQDVVTQVANNMTCDEEGQVVSCDGNELKPEKHTCADGKVVFCDEKNNVKSEDHTCADGKVVWCRKDKSEKFELHTSACYPNTNEANKEVCKSKQSTNTCTECSDDGECIASGTDADQKVSCKEDLTGITPSTGTTDTECKYCYNGDIGNDFTTIEKLGCEGCVLNEYKRKESIGSTLNLNDEVCYNGKFVEFNNAEGGNFLHVPKSNSNELWEFALNVTLVQSEGQSETPPADQFVDTPNAPSKDHSVVPVNEQFKQTWRYYNCHNDAARDFLKGLINSDDANGFLKSLSDPKESIKCCDDDSYYITQTGYRYYSVEKCTNIVLYDTHDINNGKSKPTNFSAYAYTTELNGSLIGTEYDLLAVNYACLEVRDSNDEGGEASVRQMMFIKQQPDGKSNYGIYKAFECPEKYECDLKNPYNGLCIFKEENIVKTIEGCGDFNCNEVMNTISCGNKTIAACPEGTKPRIVGGNSKCDNQSKLKLDQIQCVPDSQSIAEQ